MSLPPTAGVSSSPPFPDRVISQAQPPRKQAETQERTAGGALAPFDCKNDGPPGILLTSLGVTANSTIIGQPFC